MEKVGDACGTKSKEVGGSTKGESKGVGGSTRSGSSSDESVVYDSDFKQPLMSTNTYC